MESKHTPGPWEAIGTAVYAETPNGSREIIFSRHNTRSGTPEEQRANAHLIAAAPELLEALKKTAFVLKESGFVSPLTEEAFDDALGSAIAAIAKAGGRS